MNQGLAVLVEEEEEIENSEENQTEDVERPLLGTGIYAEPLPCFGFGIGWISFVIGFFFPFMWHIATIMYFANYYQRDPRERVGLAACAIAALIFTVAAVITVAAIWLTR